jgi:hypothetical protein
LHNSFADDFVKELKQVVDMNFDLVYPLEGDLADDLEFELDAGVDSDLEFDLEFGLEADLPDPG